MITNLILNTAYALISGLIGLLPNSDGFSSSVLSGATTFGSYFGMFSPLIPLGTLALAVGVAFSVEIGIFGWKTIKSLVSHIPQFGGSGH